MKSFDCLYEQAEEGPVVAVALLHPTNWNNESLRLLRESIEKIRSKPGVRFITAGEIPLYVPVLGRNPFGFSPRVGVLVDPREDYDSGKESFNDETFLLYVLRGYGLNAERAETTDLDPYDIVVYYSPTGEEPPRAAGRVVVLGRGRLSGVTPEVLMDPREVGEGLPRDLRCLLLKELVDLDGFSLRALEDARRQGENPYLDDAREPCERLRLAYLSREYALQIGSTRHPEAERFSLMDGDIPQIYYGTVDGAYLGYQPAPHGIAQAAREAFYAYEKTGREENLSRALFLVDYLLDTATDRGDYMIWEYPFPWPGYNLEEGWRGSLCQAGILKALMLAYKHTGEERYGRAAEKTLHGFSVPVEEGGLSMQRGDHYWYPEYVKEGPPYVLNGFVTTLIWLKEYADYSNSSLALDLYLKGLEGLEAYLPAYDAGKGWSYYDSWGNNASEDYHNLHVWQMGVMYNLTDKEIFREYYQRWAENP
jgi:hypothetical protein